MKYIYVIIGTMLSVNNLHAAGGTSGLKGLVDKIKEFATDLIIPLLVTLALALFFWGIVVSIYKSGNDPKAAAQGKNLLLWGIIALFVMISIWGIVKLVGDTFEISSTTNQGIPTLGTY